MKTTRLEITKHISLICFVSLYILLLVGCDQQKPVIAEEKAADPEYIGTIIAVGDSLTAGLGVSENNAWPALIEKRLRDDGQQWQVINAGISGETTSGALSRVDWILSQKPEIIVLETGANDGFRGIAPSVMQENITKTVQKFQTADVTVVLAGMQIVQNLGVEYTKDFKDVYPTVANKQNCLLIPFFLEHVAGEAALNQADTIHPNEAGYKLIADTVYPYVLQAIEQHSLK